MPYRVRKYRGTSTYEIDAWVTLDDGTIVRRRRKHGTNKAAAKKDAEILLANLRKYGAAGPEEKQPVPTLAGFFDAYLAGCKADGLKPSTLAVKRGLFKKHLIPRFGTRRLDSFTSADFSKLKLVLSEGRKNEKPKAPKTINNILTALSGMLNHARDEGVIDNVPRLKLVKVSREKVPMHYDREDLEELVDAARRVGHRELLVILLGADAGLREGEIAGLVHADVQLGERATIHVRRTLWQGHEQSPKSGCDRKVPLTPRLRKALAKVPRPLRGRGTTRVLQRDDGRDVSAKWIERAIRRVEEEAGMPSTGRCHILRHTFCSMLVLANTHPRVIQQLAGHASLDTTLRYMHVSRNAGDDAIEALSNLAR